jgi:hypothetical protein
MVVHVEPLLEEYSIFIFKTPLTDQVIFFVDPPYHDSKPFGEIRVIGGLTILIFPTTILLSAPTLAAGSAFSAQML